MQNYIYHNILNLEILKSILDSQTILKHPICKAVCFSRNYEYLSNRGIKMVFDIDKLKNRYKIKPYHNLISRKDESEERMYSDIVITSSLIRIDIDLKKCKKLKIQSELFEFRKFKYSINVRYPNLNSIL